MNSAEFDLCVGVVAGTDSKVTMACLRSLVSSLTSEYLVQIVLVDNNAAEQFDAAAISRELGALVIRNERRQGFGANHNQIIRSVNARYYLLLNDDTILPPAACEYLLKAAGTNQSAGFIGPRLVNEDSSIQPSAHRFPSPFGLFVRVLMLDRVFHWIPAFDTYRRFQYDCAREVDFLSGAVLLVRRDVIQDVGLLDESYYMYSEEADWCLRARKRGWSTLFVPDVSVTHLSGHSTRKHRPERSVEFLRSHGVFLKKHYGMVGLFVYRILNLLVHVPKLILIGAVRREPDKFQAECDIVLWSLGLLHRGGLRELVTVNS